ncbi:MAG: patatin-like phospholipase family protein [Kiritimatiellae bacterium]|nr:patatin-like phospholipase family protein [Kiritimatiellia bacterium]
MKKVGLALGGGGAKGLAHILMLETFDEMGIKPSCIAGTSIGSIMGALYSFGLSGSEIRGIFDKLIVSKQDSLKSILTKKDVLRWFDFLDVEFRRGGLLRGDKIIDYLNRYLKTSTFEGLQIPFKAVATDFWTCEEVVLDSGELLPAIKASMGLPGIFTPVSTHDRILIDGGGVNPLPHDLIHECEVTVAIDIMGTREEGRHKVPGVAEAIFATFQIMQNSIIAEKLKQHPPDIYIKPTISNVEMLEFYKADKIYEQAKPAQEQLKKELEKCLS